MTSWQLLRWCLGSVSLATLVVAQLIIIQVRHRRDGHSQVALISWFAAVRLYAGMLAVNMLVNAWTGHANDWAFYLFAAANVWLLYALARFLWRIRRRLL